MEFFVLIWFVSWIATIIVGSKKGEGCISVITGFFFGPVALIFAVASSGNKIKCSYCKELIEKDAVICPHCRSELINKEQPTLEQLKLKKKFEKFDYREYRTRIKKKKKIFFVIVGILLVMFLFFGIKKLSNPDTVKLTEKKSSDVNNDDYGTFINKYGEPDEIISTEHDIPRPLIVTRRIKYIKEKVVAIFVVVAPVGTPPPYNKWSFLGFQDLKSNTVLETEVAMQRMKNRIIKK